MPRRTSSSPGRRIPPPTKGGAGGGSAPKARGTSGAQATRATSKLRSSSRRAADHASGDRSTRADSGLGGYEVLVCVTGGIAAFKIAAVVSQLVQDGCGVTVAMTRNARRFVGPLTFQALTGRAVFTNPWGDGATGDQQHLKLSEAADLILVAPATANIIGKLTSGVADDLVGTLLLGADCPVVLAPAMNTRMWNHPAVRRNIATLREWGYALVGPESGWLACRTLGEGRMSEPADLVAAVKSALQVRPPRAAR